MARRWLARARTAAVRIPSAPRVELHLDTAGASTGIGSVERSLASRLVAANVGLCFDGGNALVAAPFEASFERIARWLAVEGLAGRWRDERLPVVDRQGRAHATIERGVVRALGLATFAVHLSARGADGGHWVQQRAFDKATDPGFWDTTMGGQMAAGESVRSTLERETMEEAGLRGDQLRDLRRAADVEVRRPVSEGYVNERIAVFRAVLPEGVVPINRDGEVVRFECLSRSDLEHRLAAGEFTLEATLILGAELEGPA